MRYTELPELLVKVIKESQNVGPLSRRCEIQIGNVRINQEHKFNFEMLYNGKWDIEIRRRTGKVKIYLLKLNKVLRDRDISLETKITVVTPHVISVFVYGNGCEPILS